MASSLSAERFPQLLVVLQLASGYAELGQPHIVGTVDRAYWRVERLRRFLRRRADWQVRRTEILIVEVWDEMNVMGL